MNVHFGGEHQMIEIIYRTTNAGDIYGHPNDLNTLVPTNRSSSLGDSLLFIFICQTHSENKPFLEEQMMIMSGPQL